MPAETFRSTVVPAGNATGAEVPAEVVDALGEGKRPKVAITINGHTWRSRIVTKGGRYLVGISAPTAPQRASSKETTSSSPSSSTPNRAKWTSRPT